MKIINPVYCPTRQEWHAWLETNHRSQREAWLVYYKPHSGLPSIPYEESVEEGLCFGWIDSIIKKFDEASYARKFTPRLPDSKWSETNVQRVKKLLAEGRMTPAGLEAIQGMPAEGRSRPKEMELPASLEQILRANPAAWEAFNRLPPSHRRNYVAWITSAKRAETVERRLQEAMRLLEQGKPLGLK